MSCRKIQRLLPLFVGGDLDLREATLVEGHIERCLSCFRDAKSYRSSLAPLRQLRDQRSAPSDDTFAREVMAQIDGPPPMPKLLPRLIAASGWAAAILVAVIWFTGDPLSNDEGSVVDNTPSPSGAQFVTNSNRSTEVTPASHDVENLREGIEIDPSMRVTEGEVPTPIRGPVRTFPASHWTADIRDF